LFGLGKVKQTFFGLIRTLTFVPTIALGWAQWAVPHANLSDAEVDSKYLKHLEGKRAHAEIPSILPLSYLNQNRWYWGVIVAPVVDPAGPLLRKRRISTGIGHFSQTATTGPNEAL